MRVDDKVFLNVAIDDVLAALTRQVTARKEEYVQAAKTREDERAAAAKAAQELVQAKELTSKPVEALLNEQTASMKGTTKSAFLAGARTDHENIDNAHDHKDRHKLTEHFRHCGRRRGRRINRTAGRNCSRSCRGSRRCGRSLRRRRLRGLRHRVRYQVHCSISC